jgi:hypothetical protein
MGVPKSGRGTAELLLQCLSAQVGRHSPSSWTEVADMALHLGVGPVLFRLLKRSGARAGVPAEAWKRLRLDYLASAGRNTRLYRSLRIVLNGLRSAGIRVIVLKGAFLAEAVYGDIALRPMGDVDLMVARAELPRVWAALLSMGGVCSEQGNQASPAPGVQSPDIESLCLKESHLPPFAVHDLAFEVHWTIVPPTGPVRVDTAGLWARARPARVAGVDVMALSPEDLLAHLCLHVCQRHHLDAGLQSYYDIAEVIGRFRDEIDWTQVAERVRNWDAMRYVGLILHLVGRMFGTAVPDDVLRRLIPGGPDQPIVETAWELVLVRVFRPGRVTGSLQDLWSVKPLGGKARRLSDRVFLTRAEMALEYPRSRTAKRLFYYYALRLRDVLRLNGASVQRMMLSRDTRREASMMSAVTNWLESGKH